MPYIVSANYRDRNSAYRWLIREAGEPAEKARACRAVVLEEAQFARSSEVEDGFGCSRVLIAKKATGLEFERKFQQLKHVGLGAFIDGQGNEIGNDVRFREVSLGATGEIHAEKE